MLIVIMQWYTRNVHDLQNYSNQTILKEILSELNIQKRKIIENTF